MENTSETDFRDVYFEDDFRRKNGNENQEIISNANIQIKEEILDDDFTGKIETENDEILSKRKLKLKKEILDEDFTRCLETDGHEFSSYTVTEEDTLDDVFMNNNDELRVSNLEESQTDCYNNNIHKDFSPNCKIKIENCQTVHDDQINNLQNSVMNTVIKIEKQLQEQQHNSINTCFTSHVNKPSPFQRIICQQCGKSLFNQTTLRRHMQTVHAQDHIFTCQECGITFPKKFNLKRHMITHSSETPYRCTECGMAFNRKASLDRHRGIHSGEKPFQCKDCEKTFRRKSHLEEHESIHTGNRKHTCPVCAKNFAGRPGLLRHIRTHTGELRYECPECHKKLSSKRSLRDHVMIHTGERSFVCIEQNCGKAFRTPNILKKHAKTHYKVRKTPHNCVVCNQPFTSKLKREAHISAEHPWTRKRPGPKKKKTEEDNLLNLELENT